MKAMKAIATYMQTLNGEVPYLNEGFQQTKGVNWDWTKPCYWDLIQYQCDVEYM
jgi:hypothetical protein